MLEPIKTEKLYNIIMRRISNLIQEQKLGPGDRLPPERELAMALSVSRSSVRQAITALAEKGVLIMRQGDGTYVSGINDDKHSIELFGRYLAGAQINPLEILEVRLMVECHAARLCALRADDQIILKMEKILKLYASPDTESPHLNRELHSLIAEGAQNKALLRIMSVLWDIMRGNMWPLLKRESSHDPNDVRLHWHHHEIIVAAIKNHDGEAAYKGMYEHLNSIREAMRNLMDKQMDFSDIPIMIPE
jgi:DNA-binding FadR family transcriptional regulator